MISLYSTYGFLPTIQNDANESGSTEPSIPTNPAIIDAAAEALELAGIGPVSLDAKSPKTSKTEFSKILDSSGASLEEVGAALGALLRDSDTSVKSRAVETALKAHGVMKDAERPTVPAINISILSNSGEQKNLLQLVTPNE